MSLPAPSDFMAPVQSLETMWAVSQDAAELADGLLKCIKKSVEGQPLIEKTDIQRFVMASCLALVTLVQKGSPHEDFREHNAEALCVLFAEYTWFITEYTK